MRCERRKGFGGTCAAWIPIVLSALLPILLVLLLQRVEAKQAVAITPPMSSAQVDAQIMSLLGQAETLLDEGHVTSPAGGNASDFFSRALVLSPLASPAGLRTMAEFPSALKMRADAAQAAGRMDLSVRIEIFAEVVSSVIGSRDTPSRADAAPSMQSGGATDTASTIDPAAQQAAAAATQATATTPVPGAGQAASPASGEISRGDVGAASSKASPDTRYPLPALAAPTMPIDQHVSPAAGETGLPASSGASRNKETAKGSGNGQALPVPTKPIAQHILPPAREASPPASTGVSRNVEPAERSRGTQVAALPPAAAATAAAPDGIAVTPGPPKVPPMSAAMVDALLKQGEAMLSIGDISAARLLFARAAESENGEAALALGDTYNPVFLAEHGVVGPRADPKLARAWYRKALAFGEPLARARLAGLGGDMHAEAQGSMNGR